MFACLACIGNTTLLLPLFIHAVHCVCKLIIVCSCPAMVGDVNIYMNDLDNPQLAEVEIMIAEPKRYY